LASLLYMLVDHLRYGLVGISNSKRRAAIRSSGTFEAPDDEIEERMEPASKLMVEAAEPAVRMAVPIE